MDKVPVSRRASRHAKDLGKDCWDAYKELREGYKAKGIKPQDAYHRAYVELKIGEKWRDYRSRKSAADVLGIKGSLTPGEMGSVAPGYTPVVEVKVDSVGEEMLTFAEEILWARDHRAMAESGGGNPTRFPNTGTLSWYQYSISNNDKFMQLVASVSKPAGEGENAYLQDGQYQFKEIEVQIEEAVRECGDKLIEMEASFGELIKETANA